MYMYNVVAIYIIGASLSEPHTSELSTLTCMHAQSTWERDDNWCTCSWMTHEHGIHCLVSGLNTYMYSTRATLWALLCTEEESSWITRAMGVEASARSGVTGWRRAAGSEASGTMKTTGEERSHCVLPHCTFIYACAYYLLSSTHTLKLAPHEAASIYL